MKVAAGAIAKLADSTGFDITQIEDIYFLVTARSDANNFAYDECLLRLVPAAQAQKQLKILPATPDTPGVIDLNGTTIETTLVNAFSVIDLHPYVTPVVKGATVDQSVVWHVSDEDVAYVDEDEYLWIIAPGTVTVTATTSQGLTASFKLIVKAPRT